MITKNKKVLGLSLAGGFLVLGLAVGATVYAAGSEEQASQSDIKIMLSKAIEDECMAEAEYDKIMDTFGEQKPYSNIIKAEAKHIETLLPLLEKYNVEVPNKDWSSLVTVPESLEKSYEVAANAETKNIEMYKGFLASNLPEDIKDAFQELSSASEKHLASFEKHMSGEECDEESGECSGDGGTCDGEDCENENGTGNGSSASGTCSGESCEEDASGTGEDCTSDCGGEGNGNGVGCGNE